MLKCYTMLTSQTKNFFQYDRKDWSLLVWSLNPKSFISIFVLPSYESVQLKPLGVGWYGNQLPLIALSHLRISAAWLTSEPAAIGYLPSLRCRRFAAVGSLPSRRPRRFTAVGSLSSVPCCRSAQPAGSDSTECLCQPWNGLKRKLSYRCFENSQWKRSPNGKQ